MVECRIAKPVKNVFGWSDGLIAQMTNFNNMTQIFASIFFSWVFDTWGIRQGALMMTAAMLVACGINALPVATEDHWIPSLFASCVAGLACSPWNMAPPLISATWFPAHQRTLATAFMLNAAILGWMACFVIPPALVPADAPAVQQHEAIDRQYYGMFVAALGFFLIGKCQPPTFAPYLCFVCVLPFDSSVPAGIFSQRGEPAIDICSASFLSAVLLWLPACPAVAPTQSASVSKLPWKDGLWRLAANRTYVLLVLCATVPAGCIISWAAVLDITLQVCQVLCSTSPSMVPQSLPIDAHCRLQKLYCASI